MVFTFFKSILNFTLSIPRRIIPKIFRWKLMLETRGWGRGVLPFDDASWSAEQILSNLLGNSKFLSFPISTTEEARVILKIHHRWKLYFEEFSCEHEERIRERERYRRREASIGRRSGLPPIDCILSSSFRRHRHDAMQIASVLRWSRGFQRSIDPQWGR